MNKHKISKIVLLSGRDEDRIFTQELGKSLRTQTHFTAKTTEAVNACRERENRIVLMVDISSSEDYQSFLNHFQDILGPKDGQIGPSDVHLIGPEILSDLASVQGQGCFGNFIIRTHGCPISAAHYYSRIMTRICIEGGSISCPEILKGKSGQETSQQIRITHSSEKSSVLKIVDTFLQGVPSFSSRMAEVIINAVDELLMNAIFDAPVDEGGKQRFKTLSRDNPVELDTQSTVELQMAYDGEYVGFTVIDQFGSLNRQALIKHLFQNHQENDYQVDQAVANAGLGLATTFRAGGSLVFNTKMGTRTEATAFFRFTKRYRDFKEQFRFVSIHIDL